MQASVILLDETNNFNLCLSEREQQYLFSRCVGTLALKHTQNNKSVFTNLRKPALKSTC